MKSITLFNDDDENPCNWGGWKLHSFGRKHVNYESPEKFFPASIGFRRKLQTGTAFILSYSEHGACSWHLKDKGCRSDPFDTVGTAGVLIYEGKLKELPKSFEDRQKMASDFCDTYTSWCNGEIYGFAVKDIIETVLPCGHKEIKEEQLDSCGGFYDVASMAEEVRAVVKGDEVEFDGEAAWLSAYHDFRGKAAIAA